MPITAAVLHLGPGELLIRVNAAGLRHSDLSVVVNGDRLRSMPMAIRHEATDII